MLRQPLLIEVSPATGHGASVTRPAERTVEPVRETVSQAPEPFRPDALSLDGDWELAWCEKGAGPPTNGWRTVKVPGSAHTQWLNPSQIYNRDAEWISSKEWWYRRAFTVPERFAGKRLRLQFEATDYYADTWLNERPARPARRLHGPL